MLTSRVVSLSSLIAVVASVVLFCLGAWWLMTGRMEGFDGIFALGGCTLAALVFAYRLNDPAWLQPVSIIKSV